ncbi:YhdP family protein [Gallaecimonas sp. GXIMD1310]|uniref:YhdP family protein n=1 Tax=Gallaecimonas sp. GXIMD1310 TaxID=3131926 RepID=UPI003251EFFC
MSKLLQAMGWLARKLWLLAALLVVLAAVLMSVARVAMHHLDDVRPYLVKEANARLGLQLAIGRAHGSWLGRGPQFKLSDVTVKDPDHKLSLHIDSLQVGLRFWASVLSGSPKLSYLESDGLKLALAAWPKSKEDPDWALLENLFLRQLSQARLTNAELTLPSRFGPRTVEISKVSWTGSRYRHQAVGTGSIREYGRQKVRFILDLYGLEARLSQLDGRLFVDAHDLHLDPWVNTFVGDTLTVENGVVNTRLWLDFSAGRLTGGQAHMTDSQVRFDQHDLRVKDWIGTLSSTPDGWQVDSRRAKISTDGHPWDLGAVQFRQQGADQLLYAQRLKLAPLTPLLNLWRRLPPPIKQWLAVARPNGELDDLYLANNAGQRLSGNAQLKMGWSAKDTLPGIEGVSAQLSWSGHQGLIRFDDKDLKVDPGPHFRAPFVLQRLKGDLWLLNTGENWQFRTGDLSLASPGLALDLRGKVDLGANPGMALSVKVKHLEADKASHYLPLTVMPKQVVDYLNSALQGGSAQGGVVWQGAFANYPYADGSGTFLADATFEHLHFAFDPHWPALTDTQLRARFQDAAMLLSSQHGQLAGVPIGQLQASIAHLGQQGAMLDITASTHSTGEAVTALMQQSALQGSVGKALQALQVSGGLDGNVKLAIPLGGGQPHASGDITFSDNQVRVLDTVDLTGLNGSLHFDDGTLSAKGLRARLFSQPLQLTLNSAQQSQGYHIQLALLGRFDAAKVQAPWWQVSGTTPWQGQIALLLNDPGFTLNAQLSSSLQGLASQLPVPAQKAAPSSWPLKVSAVGSDGGIAVSATLADRAHIKALLHNGKVTSWSGAIGGASLPAQQQGQGQLAAHWPTLDVGQWISALAGKLGDGNGLLPPLAKLTVTTPTLTLLGQQLHDATINGTAEVNSWKVDTKAKELEGELWLPTTDWGQSPLLVNLKRLDLQKWQAPADGAGQHWQPTDIPPFKFFCADCQIMDVNLGQLTLEGQHQGQDLLLPVLRMKQPDGQVLGSGQWLADKQQTSVQLKADVQDIGRFLNTMKLASSLRDAPLKGQLQVHWAGGPQQFAMAKVSGDVSTELGQGYVANVSDKGARLLTVFSFDSLRRKLALDFRDLFDKGLYFDRIKAAGDIKDGVIRSNKITLDGVVGDMSASGWTDLVHRQLAYDISFKPNVTGNLPVLAAFAVTPVTGVAVYALTKLFGPVIDVVTEIRFNLTGSLDNPVMKEVSRSKGSVPLPKPPAKDNKAAKTSKPLVQAGQALPAPASAGAATTKE